MKALKIISVGSSLGVILSEEVLAALNVKKGDELFLTRAPDGTFRLTPHDPDFSRQLQLADDVMREDREILRALSE